MMQPRSRPVRVVAAVLLATALGAFYYVGATEHAARVNVSRTRADQSGYLWDAVAVHGNWQGTSPQVLIGERNRMPVYPGLLALFYDPSLSPDAFFEKGKQINIVLSMVLLALLGLLFRRYLPPLPAANLLLVVAFGYFIFKAGYVQCELLLYALVFAAFVCFGHLLMGAAGARSIAIAAAGGVLAAAAHLTKASVLPLVVLFVVAYVAMMAGEAIANRDNEPGRRRLAWRVAALAVFAVCFLGTLYPYIANSKRVFGHYFYNVNTTFYVWYDDWPSASMGTYRHGDGVGWPKMPARELPSMRRYLREHSAAQIANRLGDGFRDIVVVHYERFWIMKFLVVYLAFGVAVIVAKRRALAALVRQHPALFLFLGLYAVCYLLATAFYKPISGTTSRMFLTHVAPLLFSISWLVTRAPFADVSWGAGGVRLTAAHVHQLVFALVLTDVAFVLWPRLFAHFTGY